VSLIEERRRQTEGRLGAELIRIRWLFERLRVSMVMTALLGTTPSEGEEIRARVTLLAELAPQRSSRPLLSMAARIAKAPLSRVCFFSSRAGSSQYPTYRFVVAERRSRSAPAARLGVTKDELLALVEASKRAHKGERFDRMKIWRRLLLGRTRAPSAIFQVFSGWYVRVVRRHPGRWNRRN